ncbi:type II secretion system inner membrane protein GspF [Geobacter sp. DSM 9736]|uniref:type II secretion system inner membrane protein GspF n=1 Tax=Geobacter sp. DSM 9736 TaxID=1277350 RepID=UPI000B50582E|nr:type II secretion system inner membrane protein GspF [Geobacter sp. DSM 9736]SNB47419.1 general secretion pathway protein F [Geobacter sp. DSM 9736]
MPTFRYSAYKPGGAETAGTIDAENPRDARERLKKKGLYPREIIPAEEVAAKGLFAPLRRRVSLADLSLMTRRLATLLGSAVPVYEAVTTLQQQERAGELRNVLGRIRDRLAEGSNLAKAMGAEPRIFSESYINMVAAGEASGALEVVLERLAEFLEDQEQVRSKVVTSLAYPVLMMVVGTGVMLFLLAFVVPRIITVFQESKAALPLITVVLIKVSTLLQHWWWLLVLVGCVVAIAYDRGRRKESFRAAQDRLILRLPLVGPLWQRLILSRFAKVLGLLLQSGVPMIRAMEISGDVVVNRQYRSVLAQARAELTEGGSLSAALGRSSLFPPLLVHMIAVGERGGELETMLLKAGSAFEKEFDTAISRFMALLEPLLVLGMGLAVGVVVLAVLLPIFQLNQLIK